MPRVQVGIGAQDGASAVTGTGGTGFGSNTTPGNSFAVSCSWGSSTIAITSVTDSKGNTYVQRGTTITGFSRSIAIFDCLTPSSMGAGHTIQMNLASSSFDLQIIAHEVSGIAAATFGEFVSDNAEAGTTVDVPTVTPGQSAYLFGTVRACGAAGQTFTPDASSGDWSEGGEVNFGTDSDSQTQDLFHTSGTAITCKWTMSGAGDAICALASYLLPPSAPSTIYRRLVPTQRM